MTKIAGVEYSRGQFSDSDVLADPFAQFASWWNDAISASLLEIDAAHLATVDKDGHPDGRVVLLKNFDARGFVFFTNYESKKAEQLNATPFAAMTIYWQKLERQIRIRGFVHKTSVDESRNYFASRPRGAQISALVSPQSKPIKDRTVLEHAFAEKEKEFSEKDIPCPANWGGFCLVPNYFEFWQGRKSRLHDRFGFKKNGNAWNRQRLAP